MDMDIRFGKALDSGLHDSGVLKRKRHEICSAGTTQISVPLQTAIPGSSIRTPAKRMKLDGRNKMHSGSVFQPGKRLLRYYSNLKRSAPPQRLLYHHDDNWCDFPQEVVMCIKDDFLANKTTVEVEFEGTKNLLDFLHMTKLDLGTGFCQPIAWIDVSGKCFFPEIIGDCDEVSNEYDKDEGLRFQDINLHLEVEIKGLDAYKYKESTGESSGICQVQTHGNSSEEYVVTNSSVGGTKLLMNHSSGTMDKMEDKIDLVKGYMKKEAVKELLFRGIRASGQAKIVELSSCSGNAIEARYELFLKQVEIMKKYRGDANVLYAWLPCSRKTVTSVLNYGVGCYGLSRIDPMHGLGVHLIPANGTDISERYFDVDENGMCYMVLCRVIMGNMELVSCGSNQFHPSSDEFDSGVDNLQNPKHYVVWGVNTNTHIYPECVVTFKLSSDVKGPPRGNGTMVAAFPEETIPLVQGNVGHRVLDEPAIMSAKTPQSPYMSFSMLFAAIAKRVPPSKMEIVKAEYDLFRSQKINRDDFVRKLRSICGDALLKSTITSIRSNGSPLQTKCL